MKYYIIAGEASGDMYAANLMKELRKLDCDASFRVFGGDRMQAQGAELVVHYRQMNFMGFFEVAANIFTILRLLKKCKTDLLAFAPDVLILVDYPGFNLRMARFAHINKIKVFYYIAPQIWAWKQSRVYKIKEWVLRVYTILPFEKAFYARFGVDVDFAGHPLPDALCEISKPDPSIFRKQIGIDQRPVIALLPGSRYQEVSKMLKTMLGIIPEYPGFQFVVAGANSLPESVYRDLIGNARVTFVYNQTYMVLQIAEAALVTSGTATLETALFKVPQVVCYKANPISYIIGKQLVKINYISLVNLIMNKPVVKELLQRNFNHSSLINELNKIIFDQPLRQQMIQHYHELEKLLGGKGASARIAHLMHERLIQPKD